MGNSYNRNMTTWHDGATPYGCVNTQDNLSIITSVNGFGYRADDYSDSLDNASYSTGGTSFSLTGIITTNTDKDVFKLTLPSQSTVHLEAIPFAVGSANSGSNLDIKIQIYDELREAWAIPDLVLKLESRIREVYEILRIELSEVEAKKNERRNLWLTMITVLTGFQMIWSLWDFIFEPTNLLTISNYWRLGMAAVTIIAIVTILLRFLLPLRRKSTEKSKQ
jgi:hypothetical protein